jgi:hypothetical protein
MTFGPALSLGVASLCEVVDVKIAADIDPAALLAELSDGSHGGLRFVGGVRLGANDASVSRVVDVAQYVVGIPRTSVDAKGGDAWLKECSARAMAATDLGVLRRIEGIGKRVNVREFLRRIDVGEGAEALVSAGITGSLAALSVEVEIRGSGGVKISEVVEAVLGDAELPHRAVRTFLGARLPDGGMTSPLALETLRERASQRPLGAPLRRAVGEAAPS